MRALDLLRGTLIVQETLVRTAHNEKVIGPPKSEAGRRTLTLPRSMIAVLAEHLAACALSSKDGDSFVFSSGDGKPLDYSNWRRRVWVPACETAGLQGIGFHDLRRVNATALVQAGVDLKTAQTRLGHSDPRLTLAIYAQAITEADRSAAKMLEEQFGFGS